MKRLFSLTRALVARKRKIFALFFALAASIGMSWASVTWISDQYGNYEEKGYYAGTPFTKDGVTVTMSDDAFFIVSYWGDASLQCVKGTFDPTAGNYVFSNSLGENFVKIIIAAGYTSDWEWFPKGDGWVLSGDENNGYILTWTGNASTVTLMDNELHSVNQSIEGDIVFYFESDIEEAAPTITVGALEHGSVVASPTSAEAGETITLTATPEAGYKLNTIEATYFGAANETLSVRNMKNVGRGITAVYNKSTYIYVSSYDGAYNLTVSTNDGTNLIRKIEIEFEGPGVNDARTNSMLSSDHGSWAFEDGDPCTKATINNINAVSVVLSGSGVGMNKAWFPKTMKVYYDGDVLIGLTDTENANVKTFTMVDKAVNVFAEFIPMGSCGENLTWEYSPSTGALVISGTGAMSDYDNNMNKAPWYAYRESISSISLPDGLTYIGKHAFRECNNFTQLVVPNSVTEIGNTAFQDCSKLWSLTLPNTLEKIGGAAFERTKISNFTIPEGVTSLDGYVFGECTSLYRVNIHAGVTSLTGNVFYNCTNLNTIYSYVEKPVAITGAVFEGVNKANCKLYVPFNSMAAYQAADEWKDFFIKPIPGTAPTLYLDIDGASATLIYGYPEDGKPAYNEEYGQWNNLDYSYRNDNLKTLTIDASCRENVMTSFKNLFQYFQAVETIRNMAYLSTVNVTNMQSMFEYCKKLTELDLHTFNTAKVTNMETMFSECSQLVTLDISSFNTSNVTSMYYMFTYDDKLEHIYVGDGWNTDNVTKHERMFQYCGELPNYNYNYLDKTKAHTGDGGYLTALTQIGAWESGDCDVILYSNGRMSVTKKAGNGNGAMANYANKDAQPWADYRNVVTKLDIEDGVKEIGTCAFYDFREMTQLNISEGVTAIHENAFRNGKKLTILILPSTLRVLGDEADAFTGCPITDIYLTAHPARLTWNEDNDDFIYSFSNPEVHKTTVCHVPANLADAYVAKFITGVEEDKQPNVTFEGGMPAVDMITPEDVIALINEIGEVAYTAECKAKIDAAREAYDGLVDEEKEQVTNYETLTNAETAYAQLLAQAVAAVKDQIDALPATPLTDATKKLSEYNKVTDAREAYDALSDEEKAAVTNYDKLEAAEAAFAAIPSVGSETVITWDKNTGIEKISGTATSPAYEGITISIKGGGFGPENDMLRFNIAGLGLSFEFANTLEGNFQKIVISSTNAMPSTPLAGMGEGWAASNENKTATWTGDAATVKIWDGLTATSYWDVNTIQFTLGATVSATEAAQAAKDLIDAIGEVSYPDSKEAIKAAREAVDALGANASLLENADLQKLTDAEAAYAQLLAQAVKAVKDQIDALPDTPLQDADKKLSEYNKVTDAREAYDALSDDEKAAVTNYDKLEAAEAAFAAIGGGSGSAPAGALNGAFTINADGDQIVFSKGNLQYQASTTTLRFATNQYDMIGADNANISDTYTGWIDLFGWGTGNRPAYSSTVDEDYSTFTDWGTNAISNGGNEANLWRTMTVQEWNHLIKNRTNAAHLKGQATVADVHGYVLLPDSWTLPAGLSFTANPNNWTTNVYTAEQWTQMEAAGAVFLPAAGYREPEIEGVGEKGWYWASNVVSDAAAYCFEFDETTSRVFGSRIYFGQPVRLVAVAATASPLADAQAALDKINAIPDPVVLSDECKAKIDAAREAVTALGENASLLDDADIDKLAKAEADFALLIKDATAVAGMIDAIGEVTFSADSKGKIVDARNAYEALSDELKSYVSNLDKLTAAEAAYEAARPFATVTTVPAAVEALQYTGAAQTLITAGAAEHGTVLYSLDGENYSTELPTALLPGAYTVYYKVQATDDYKDVAPVTVIATIAYNYPATYGLFGIPEGWSVKVNDEEVAVVNGAVKNIAANDRFDIMPVKPEDVKRVEIVPYLLDLATVTDSVIYVLDGDSITGTANGHITVVIVPDAKVYFKDVNLTNTGSHPAVLCGGNAEIVVVGENTITCTKEGEYGIRAAGAGTTLTISGDKTLLNADIDPNGGTVNQ
ncbi:MAG: leucine-rich repeat protein [Paludibacteraceae bacterium]|nr:leucine-rich repeat protein [Paludibacteraceae bacterium]